MSSSNLIRWSGLAALVGGALFAILDVVEFVLIGGQPQSVAAATGGWVIIQVALFVASVLISLGLIGAYAHQADQAGTLGLITFLVAFIGTTMVSGLLWSAAFMGPFLAVTAPEALDAEPSGLVVAGVLLTFVLFGLGWLLFGLTLMRTRVLPRAVAALLMIGAIFVVVLGLLDLPFISVPFGVAVASMGYMLWSGPAEPTMIADAAR